LKEGINTQAGMQELVTKIAASFGEIFGANGLTRLGFESAFGNFTIFQNGAGEFSNVAVTGANDTKIMIRGSFDLKGANGQVDVSRVNGAFERIGKVQSLVAGKDLSKGNAGQIVALLFADGGLVQASESEKAGMGGIGITFFDSPEKLLGGMNVFLSRVIVDGKTYMSVTFSNMEMAGEKGSLFVTREYRVVEPAGSDTPALAEKLMGSAQTDLDSIKAKAKAQDLSKPEGVDTFLKEVLAMKSPADCIALGIEMTFAGPNGVLGPTFRIRDGGLFFVYALKDSTNTEVTLELQVQDVGKFLQTYGESKRLGFLDAVQYTARGQRLSEESGRKAFVEKLTALVSGQLKGNETAAAFLSILTADPLFGMKGNVLLGAGTADLLKALQGKRLEDFYMLTDVMDGNRVIGQKGILGGRDVYIDYKKKTISETDSAGKVIGDLTPVKVISRDGNRVTYGIKEELFEVGNDGKLKPTPLGEVLWNYMSTNFGFPAQAILRSYQVLAEEKSGWNGTFSVLENFNGTATAVVLQGVKDSAGKKHDLSYDLRTQTWRDETARGETGASGFLGSLNQSRPASVKVGGSLFHWVLALFGFIDAPSGAATQVRYSLKYGNDVDANFAKFMDTFFLPQAFGDTRVLSGGAWTVYYDKAGKTVGVEWKDGVNGKEYMADRSGNVYEVARSTFFGITWKLGYGNPVKVVDLKPSANEALGTSQIGVISPDFGKENMSTELRTSILNIFSNLYGIPLLGQGGLADFKGVSILLNSSGNVLWLQTPEMKGLWSGRGPETNNFAYLPEGSNVYEIGNISESRTELRSIESLTKEERAGASNADKTLTQYSQLSYLVRDAQGKNIDGTPLGDQVRQAFGLWDRTFLFNAKGEGLLSFSGTNLGNLAKGGLVLVGVPGSIYENQVVLLVEGTRYNYAENPKNNKVEDFYFEDVHRMMQVKLLNNYIFTDITGREVAFDGKLGQTLMAMMTQVTGKPPMMILMDEAGKEVGWVLGASTLALSQAGAIIYGMDEIYNSRTGRVEPKGETGSLQVNAGNGVWADVTISKTQNRIVGKPTINGSEATVYGTDYNVTTVGLTTKQLQNVDAVLANAGLIDYRWTG
ncbi:MAG: hypothetical protein WCK00_06980, partial [Deltaproteobacteria bacterium]